MNAKSRYDALRGNRDDFLSVAMNASALTLPYLVKNDDDTSQHKNLRQPWQSVGAKAVVSLSAKLMLALLPPQSSFFQLQMDETKVMAESMDPKIKSDLDLSFAKVERTIMDLIAQSDDRVIVHQALKHLVVSGNALIFMDKEMLKLYPLNRYVVDRDGSGNVVEIVTKEQVSRELVPNIEQLEPVVNEVSDNVNQTQKDVDIYTHVKREGKYVRWYQEVYGKVIPGTRSSSPLKTQPWLALRFNVVDGEAYGRGRVEEFLGDLKSLEALSQALVEGSAAAAKVVFTVSPSSTTKPATLAQAGNGAIVQARPDDVGVVQVGKSADFSTAYAMAQGLERRISEAFLVLQVRDSERTTAEEVRTSQLELDSQLGGLYSLLTVDFLVPYLNRKLDQAQKKGDIPKLPKGIVKPAIVAGVNAIGRGQDRESLMQFMTTLAQALGPEAIGQFINTDELIKRLAASSGIDVLNLVKSMQERQQEAAQQQEQAQQLELTKQAAQMQRNNIDLQQNGNTQEAQNPTSQTQDGGV